MEIFRLTVLVFGLSSASFIFTKVVKWRSQAIRIFRFTDDVFGGGGGGVGGALRRKP